MCQNCNLEYKSPGIEEASQSDIDAYNYYEEQRLLALELQKWADENEGESVVNGDDNTDFDYDPNDERDYRLAS